MEDQTAFYEKKKKDLEEEIDIFKYVRNLYRAKVSSNADDFKDRINDYTKDGSFDDGDYNDRGVDSIEKINKV